MIISDATYLPPPYRIENRSPVALFYQQALCRSGSQSTTPPPPPSGRSGVTSGQWSDSIFINRLPPRSAVNYAPEEPLLPPLISVGVQVISKTSPVNLS